MSEPRKNELAAKLLSLYESNLDYINTAEKYLSAKCPKDSDSERGPHLTKEDIDRLYSHVYVLEHIAKLLYEEFFITKNGRLPPWKEGDLDRRDAKN
jgi:hypothetical protein